MNIDKSIRKIIGKPKAFGGRKDWDGDGVPNKRDCQPRNVMRQDTFTQMVLNAKRGKGWFEVKDIVPLYINFRNPAAYQKEYMSGDASWRLKLMVDSGKLERKQHPRYKTRFLYRVI